MDFLICVVNKGLGYDCMVQNSSVGQLGRLYLSIDDAYEELVKMDHHIILIIRMLRWSDCVGEDGSKYPACPLVFPFTSNIVHPP